jgi:hypothetical protein
LTSAVLDTHPNQSNQLTSKPRSPGVLLPRLADRRAHRSKVDTYERDGYYIKPTGFGPDPLKKVDKLMKKLATTDERLSQVTAADQNDRHRNNMNVFRAKNQSALHISKQSKALVTTHRSVLDDTKPLGTVNNPTKQANQAQDADVFRITLSKKPETTIEQAVEFGETSIHSKQLTCSQQQKVIKIHPKAGGADSLTHRRLLTQVQPSQKHSIRANNQTLGSKQTPSGRVTANKNQPTMNSLDEGNSCRLTKNLEADDEPRETEFVLDCIEDVDQTILKIQGPYRPLGMNASSSKNSLYTTSPTTLVPFVLLLLLR